MQATVLSLVCVLLVPGCDPGATAPSGNIGTISLLVVSGGGQSGVVGTELPQPLVIKATNSKGAAIADVTVNFRVTSGGGGMYAGAVSTDNKGIAEDYWTLGTSTAQVQQVEVRAVLSNGQKQVYGVFNAAVFPGPAAHIAVQAGDGQTANVSSAVAIAPAVLVADQYGNPVPGVAVTFVPAPGSGSVAGGTSSTDVSGIARVGNWTLGSTPGANTLVTTANGNGIAGNPVTFTATGITPPGNYWSTVAPMPTGRSDLGVAAINGVLYAVGGVGTSHNTTLATVEAYDPATDTWTTKAPMPTPRDHLGVTAIDGILYAVGGQNASGVVGTVEAYDPATDTWMTKASMPTARFGLGVVAIGGILYAVGGADYQTLYGTVEAYNPATDAWSTRASMPAAVYQAGVAAINGMLYSVGGYGAMCSGCTIPVGLDTVQVYDPASDSWHIGASMPTWRYALSAADVNGILYAVGGGQISAPAPFDTVEAYDPATDSWTRQPHMPTARTDMAAIGLNGILYVIGGGGVLTGGLPTVEAYKP